MAASPAATSVCCPGARVGDGWFVRTNVAVFSSSRGVAAAAESRSAGGRTVVAGGGGAGETAAWRARAAGCQFAMAAIGSSTRLAVSSSSLSLEGGSAAAAASVREPGAAHPPAGRGETARGARGARSERRALPPWDWPRRSRALRKRLLVPSAPSPAAAAALAGARSVRGAVGDAEAAPAALVVGCNAARRELRRCFARPPRASPEATAALSVRLAAERRTPWDVSPRTLARQPLSAPGRPSCSVRSSVVGWSSP